MKKNIMLMLSALTVAILSATTLAACSKDGVISPDQMPNKAKNFIETYFPDCSIIEVEYGLDDDDFYREKDYDVELSCSVEIEFNKNGEWMSVDCSHNQVPDGIVPEAILGYVKQQYPDNFITSIEKERNGYDVELNYDIDLKFDKDGNFLRVDR